MQTCRTAIKEQFDKTRLAYLSFFIIIRIRKLNASRDEII